LDILVDYELLEFGKLYVEPFDPAQVNPASLDLRLGNEFVDMATGREYVLEPGERFYMHSGRGVLAITQEHITIPPTYAADLKMKTTPCRMGVNHSMAGWIDPGYAGQLTLTLDAMRDAVLVPGTRICQIIIYSLGKMPTKPYNVVGHYMGQTKPTPAWTGDER
jgi:dCTP deaminase